jgi:hypothetical protein
MPDYADTPASRFITPLITPQLAARAEYAEIAIDYYDTNTPRHFDRLITPILTFIITPLH